MAEKHDEMSLPNANIMRLLKEAIPEGVNVSKDARVTFGKAGVVFVLFLTACANSFAMKAKRKTLVANDIFEALSEADLLDFLEPLKKSLEAFQQEKNKKDSASAAKRKKAESSAGNQETVHETQDDVLVSN